MDISVENKRSSFTLTKLLLGILILAGIAAGIFWINQRTKLFRVDSAQLMISPVQKGDLIIEVRGAGSLLPESHYWISSANRATLDKLYVKTGDIVQKNQLLMSFSDPALSQQLQAMAWKIKKLKAQLKAKDKSLEVDLAEQRVYYEKAKFEYMQVQQEVNIESQLRQKNYPQLGDAEWNNLLIKKDHSLEVMRLEKSRVATIKASRKADLEVIRTQLNECLFEQDLIAKKLDNLEIKAPQKGFIQNLSVEAGQVIETGTPLVKLTSIDEFYVELKISQDQIAQVEKGQKAVISTRHGSIAGFVRHIHGAVDQGFVAVDIELTAELPKGLKEGQRVEGTITTDYLSDTLFVNRPSFIQANQTGWVFRLDKAGKTAERIKASFGKIGVHYIEVKSGLTAGDKIIVSELGNWSMEDKILIQ